MASSSSAGSSSPIKSCIHCKHSSSETLMNGWKSRTGDGFVQLCASCFALYEAGQFCEAFHGHENGWRDCNSCKKLLHCGCIVSLDDYSMDDFGGITCNECTKAMEMHLATSGSNPQDLEVQPSAVLQAVLIPLFEKVMTENDTRLRNNRVAIPKKHATAYFPQVSVGKMVPLQVLDTDGKFWHLFYRLWVYKRNTMYVLFGLKDFMVSKSLQAGDTVAFYWRESDEKIILELKKKNSAGASSHHASS